MVLVQWMTFPLFSIQAMTDDFPEKLPLLKEWISPKGLREISITFLLVAQLVTEREKETGQYFKAKTSIGNSRYRTSIFLHCLLPKHDFSLLFFTAFYVFSALSQTRSSEVGFPEYVSGCPHVSVTGFPVLQRGKPSPGPGAMLRLLGNWMISGPTAQIGVVPYLVFICIVLFSRDNFQTTVTTTNYSKIIACLFEA